jgi:hypothetical protein
MESGSPEARSTWLAKGKKKKVCTPGRITHTHAGVERVHSVCVRVRERVCVCASRESACHTRACRCGARTQQCVRAHDTMLTYADVYTRMQEWSGCRACRAVCHARQARALLLAILASNAHSRDASTTRTMSKCRRRHHHSSIRRRYSMSRNLSVCV